MTTRSLLAVGGYAGVASNSVSTAVAPHGMSRSSTASVDTFHYRPPVALTLTKLAVYNPVADTATGKTFKVYKNGTASTLAVNIAIAGVAGSFTENKTDSVSVYAGDKISMVAEKTGGGVMFCGNRMVLVTNDSRAISPMVATTTGNVLDNSARYLGLSGDFRVSAYDPSHYLKVRSPGDWRGLYAYISANSGSGSITINGSRNNIDVAMSISIGPGETGYFFDNANVVSVVDGDNLLYRKTGTSGASATLMVLGSSVVNLSKKQQIFGYASRPWTCDLTNSGIYRGIPGNDYGSTISIGDLPKYERTLGYPATISYLQVGTYNALDVPVVTTLLVNGIETALSVTTPNSASNAINEDSINSVSVSATDKIALVHKSVGATSGNFYAETVSILIEDATPEPYLPSHRWH